MQFLLIFMAIILVTIILLVADFYFGRKKHLSLVKKREATLLHGHFDIFPHGKDLFADYFKECKNAKYHIHVLFYIVKNDPISHEFLTILKEKAQEGVEVRLLIDRLGSIQMTKEIVRDLKKASVQFAFSNQLRLPYLFYSSQVRNHRKVSIIDGEIGYLGGFNVGKEYIDLDPKLSPWRDYHLKITGMSVSSLQRVFLTDWKEYAGIDLLENRFYFRETAEGTIQHKFLATEACQLEDVYVKLIQNAQSSIIIGTPYFIPSKKLLIELLEAIRRGAHLTVIVPATADHVLVQEASYRYFRPLLKEGAKVYQYQNGFYHAKTIIIDQKICDVGTANFDKRSLFLNKEINCYIYDEAFTKRVEDIIKKDIVDSKPLLLKDIMKPNFVRACNERIAAAVSFFL